MEVANTDLQWHTLHESAPGFNDWLHKKVDINANCVNMWHNVWRMKNFTIKQSHMHIQSDYK